MQGEGGGKESKQERIHSQEKEEKKVKHIRK